MMGIASSKAVVLGCMSAERARLAAGRLCHAYRSPRGYTRRPDYMIDSRFRQEQDRMRA